MGEPKRKRAWRGKPKRFDLVGLFVPDCLSERRLDCGSAVGNVQQVLGASGQRALERFWATASSGTTPRQWRSFVGLMKRMLREHPSGVNYHFKAWLESAFENGPDACLETPLLSWDLIRLSRPDWISKSERLTQDHWALLQKHGEALLRGLDFDARLAAGDEISVIREISTGIRADPILAVYWTESSLVQMESSGTLRALELARICAFMQALVSQVGLVQASEESTKASIDAMVELDTKRGRCNPGGALLRVAREALGLPTVESLLERIQIADCDGPNRSTLMAWSSGRQFPSSKLWWNMIEALRSPEDPEFRDLPDALKDGTLGWVARRVNGVLQTFGRHWPALHSVAGKAESLDAWLGPRVHQWHQHWVDCPLPQVELPKFPSIVR